MKRSAVLLVGVVLAMPASALAGFYSGPFKPEVNNDGVEIKVKFRHGRPRKVTEFEFHNVPTGTPCNGSNVFFGAMKVNDLHRFGGSGHPGKAGNPNWPPTPNLTVTIHGQFKNHNEKIAGTLRLRGKGGCSGDTGRLSFVVPRIK
jgi:hypothetical protein